MTTIKICDVRDYATGRYCADLGVDFLGLHCIEDIDALAVVRRNALEELVSRARNEFPHVGLVAVTLLPPARADGISKIVETLRPSHVQLHSKDWDGRAIQLLRDQLASTTGDTPKVIAVCNISDATPERIDDLCDASDILLLDRTDYESDTPAPSVDPQRYVAPVAQAKTRGTPTFLAGGLAPENVRAYLEVVRPWGVDVQSGLQVSPKDKRKDPAKISAFIEVVRSFGSDSRK